MTILERVKARLTDTTVSDELIDELIDGATFEVLATTNQDKLNQALEYVVAGSVVIAINRMGTEGVSSESYSSVSTSYADGLPANLQSILNANRKLGAWSDSDDTEAES